MIHMKSVGHETKICAAEMKFVDFSLANFFELFCCSSESMLNSD